jgi:hypothetical protein
MITTKQYSYGTFRIDNDLCYQIWKIHNKNKTQSTHNIKLENHPLLNRKIILTKENKTYNIEGVYKQWYAGWYIILLIECNKSHTMLCWENINCIDSIITEQITENNIDYKLI